MPGSCLRPAHRVGILSNADLSLRQRLGELGIADLFDDVICSAEVGMAKPEPAIYRLAAGQLGLPPEACVFVDDYEPHVIAAEEVGMCGILLRVDRGQDLRAELAVLGVHPPEG